MTDAGTATGSLRGSRRRGSARSPRCRRPAPTGSSGSGDSLKPAARSRGSVSRKQAPWPGSPQASSQPPCSRASSSEIARPRPVPPGRARAGGVGTPEAVEHQGRLPGSQPDAEVAHRHGHGVVVVGDRDVDPAEVAVLDRVLDQVADDAVHATRVAVDQAGLVGRDQPDVEPVALGQRLGRVDGALHERDEVDAARGRARRRPRRTARSRAGRRAGPRTGRAGSAGARPPATVGASSTSRSSYTTSAAMRIVVSGVRSSCDTSETKRCCTRDSSSSWRIWRARLTAIALNDVARRARSSVPLTFMRSDRLPSASRAAVCEAARTGTTTWRVTSQATNASSRTSRIPV